MPDLHHLLPRAQPCMAEIAQVIICDDHTAGQKIIINFRLEQHRMGQHPGHHHLLHIPQRIINTLAVFQQLPISADGIKKDAILNGQPGEHRLQQQIATLQHPFFPQAQVFSQRHPSRLPFLPLHHTQPGKPCQGAAYDAAWFSLYSGDTYIIMISWPANRQHPTAGFRGARIYVKNSGPCPL